jgi:hypothetical protein
MSKTKFHPKRFARVMEDILDNPKHWNQGSWHCGTSHCWAGFAEMRRIELDPAQRYQPEADPEYCGASDPAAATRTLKKGLSLSLGCESETQEWVGLTDLEWDRITSGSNDLCELLRLTYEILEKHGHKDKFTPKLRKALRKHDCIDPEDEDDCEIAFY